MRPAERTTIRKYSDKEVSEEELTELIELACRASNTGNMQTYSVIVTRDVEQKRRLSPAHFSQPMVEEAAVVLTFCVDFNRFSTWCHLRDAAPGYDNFQSFIGAAVDTSLFAQLFTTLAEERGMGVCFLGTTTYNAQPIIDALELPKLVVPITTVTLGYPAEMPTQQDRLPVKGIWHREKYEEYTATDIDDIYREKESLPESKQYVEENGKSTLAQVYTDVRYTKSNSEYFSEEYLKVLRNQGFL